ncbi:dienelactone hydrolase family protein [Marinobacterium sediminicola]|uniref:Carboxymethylenebutenolidase n=1 Tax=Marinobacterium sediminicola TaxID=518898 RepID=A0ABY1S4J1_9GAMM|nr:dienelactone hydrolase family protein [Marinobacterium sediminicola]ULG68943.1 dienelactone hydrolase family protein [Marinobacterium sediminicola]SMR78446.1 carboxymethylenebutenolidase [Marinobacterium sediminicola]
MCDIKGCGSKPVAELPTISIEQRRRFLKGMLALPLAVVLADPLLAQAAGQRTQKVELPLSTGSEAGAHLAIPEGEGPFPAVVLIHEWWGLNDQIKAVAAELAEQGFIALAVDLYGGKVADTREGAMALKNAVDPAVATSTLTGWIDWLRQHELSNGRVGTLGWCFGGGWSLDASLATPVDATIIYYGNVRRTPEQLASLQGPVQGHFGTLDKSIDEEMVGSFERAMAKAGKDQLQIHWYVADHAFANPTGARYDEENAALSWSRSLAFLHQHLGGL